MIEFKNVSKVYPGNVKALDSINLAIKPKEFISIIGKSGSGKTSLAKLLIAQEKPSKGEIIVGGWNITKIRQSEVPLLRRQLGTVFQEFNLLPGKTVRENVSFALEVAGMPYAKIKKIVDPVLKIVGLEGKGGRYIREISGGEAQRVAIARALAHRPKVLIADEPTGNLDTINSQEIIDLLKKINEYGTVVVLMTHDKEIVNSLKRRVIVMEQGRIISDKEGGKYTL